MPRFQHPVSRKQLAANRTNAAKSTGNPVFLMPKVYRTKPYPTLSRTK